MALGVRAQCHRRCTAAAAGAGFAGGRRMLMAGACKMQTGHCLTLRLEHHTIPTHSPQGPQSPNQPTPVLLCHPIAPRERHPHSLAVGVETVLAALDAELALAAAH